MSHSVLVGSKCLIWLLVKDRIVKTALVGHNC
jgi:hypothetical protein